MNVESIVKGLAVLSTLALILAVIAVVLAITADGEAAIKWSLIAIAAALISKVVME
jgi:hypothetical protein